MKFCKVKPGLSWFCPWCGTRTLDPHWIELKAIGRCTNCKRLFEILIESLPDPNSKQCTKECTKKRQHLTIDSAFKHCEELPEKAHRNHKNLCIYKCRICNFYHVGHKGKTTRNASEHVMYLQLKKEKQCLQNIPQV